MALCSSGLARAQSIRRPRTAIVAFGVEENRVRLRFCVELSVRPPSESVGPDVDRVRFRSNKRARVPSDIRFAVIAVSSGRHSRYVPCVVARGDRDGYGCTVAYTCG